jgi:hypothetical protein
MMGVHNDINSKINVDHQAAARPPHDVPCSRCSRRFLPPVPACTETGSSYIMVYVLLTQFLE